MGFVPQTSLRSLFRVELWMCLVKSLTQPGEETLSDCGVGWMTKDQGVKEGA